FMFKPREFHSFSGSTYFSAGVFLTLLFFKADIAAAGIVYLSLGDMAAVTVGEKYGRISFAGKTIEGSAAFVTVTFIAVSLLNISGIFDINFSYPAIFAAAIICAAVELFPLKIDDNFILPIVGAAVLKLLS
ncbi:MAG: hypothetical protein U9R36_07345, partial [Elusimicrobiota bacterium]|nr:hypothetical protein [Elusimicrobiota bacterium]